MIGPEGGAWGGGASGGAREGAAGVDILVMSSSLIIKLITDLVCKLRDESNESN